MILFSDSESYFRNDYESIFSHEEETICSYSYDFESDIDATRVDSTINNELVLMDTHTMYDIPIVDLETTVSDASYIEKLILDLRNLKLSDMELTREYPSSPNQETSEPIPSSFMYLDEYHSELSGPESPPESLCKNQSPLTHEFHDSEECYWCKDSEDSEDTEESREYHSDLETSEELIIVHETTSLPSTPSSSESIPSIILGPQEDDLYVSHHQQDDEGEETVNISTQQPILSTVDESYFHDYDIVESSAVTPNLVDPPASMCSIM